MSPSTVGMAAPFRWLRQAFDVGRRNPKALFGAIALMIVVVMAITMAQMFLQVLAQGSMTGLMVVMGLMTAVNWVVMPPLVGGLFRVVDATDRGLPVVASDVFNAYGRGQGGKRLILGEPGNTSSDRLHALFRNAAEQDQQFQSLLSGVAKTLEH